MNDTMVLAFSLMHMSTLLYFRQKLEAQYNDPFRARIHRHDDYVAAVEALVQGRLEHILLYEAELRDDTPPWVWIGNRTLEAIGPERHADLVRRMNEAAAGRFSVHLGRHEGDDGFRIQFADT